MRSTRNQIIYHIHFDGSVIDRDRENERMHVSEQYLKEAYEKFLNDTQNTSVAVIHEPRVNLHALPSF